MAYKSYNNNYNPQRNRNVDPVPYEPLAEEPVLEHYGKVVNCQKCYIRSNSSKESKPETIVEVGTKAKILDEEGNWFMVEGDGFIGYIMKDFFKEI